MKENYKFEFNYKELRKLQREEKIRKFILRSKLFWILDSRPYETHMIGSRTVIENQKREKIRRKYSWHNLAKFQNDEIFKVGLFGIVTAPILAGFSKNELPFISFSFPIQMFFIFLSGILYVMATSLYRYRVPCFVSEYLDDKNKKFHAMPMKELNANIYLEFLKLSSVAEVTHENIKDLKSKKNDFESASILLSQGVSVFKVGFSTSAQAYIENFIYKIAEIHGFNIYTESRDDKGKIILSKGMGGSVIYTNETLYCKELIINRLEEHFALNRYGNDIKVNNQRDLVINFFDSNITFSDGIDKRLNNDAYTHGLYEIIREEYKVTLIKELSYWQSWQRPFSRLAIYWLYKLSLLSFIIFLAFQAKIVFGAVIE